MADDDDRRVEARFGGLGRGLPPSSQSIADLQQRVDQFNRLNRPSSSRTFGAVLRGKRVADVVPREDPTLSSQGREESTTMPRPGLVHPSQRERFARRGEDEVVVIKG